MRSNISRRKFLGSSSLGLGALGFSDSMASEAKKESKTYLPNYVNVGTVSTAGISATDANDMVAKSLRIMDSVADYQPDIICLPEIFAYGNTTNSYKINEVAETVPGEIITSFLNFASQRKCYVICPTYTRHDGNVYISAVLIDRNGKVVGEYNKLRPTIDEMSLGVKPGKSGASVFHTDFGKIGIQICFDIKFEDGWNSLKDQGAQIIFWPSAYAAGQEISARAWRHQVYIVSSTQTDTSRICDLTGASLAQTGRWQPNWTVASLNLEKTLIHAWPSVDKFPSIEKKYKSRIKIVTYSEEEWATIESLDPNLKINDVLKEFDLKNMSVMLNEVAAAHKKALVGS